VLLKWLLKLELLKHGEESQSVLKHGSLRVLFLNLPIKLLVQKIVQKLKELQILVHHVLVGLVLAQLLVVVGIPLMVLMLGSLLLL